VEVDDIGGTVEGGHGGRGHKFRRLVAPTIFKSSLEIPQSTSHRPL